MNKDNKCFTLRLLLGFRVVRVYYLVVVVCYRLVYTVHCACSWAWLGSYILLWSCDQETFELSYYAAF